MKNLDKILRKFIPSLAKATYNPIVRNCIDLISAIPNIFFPDFKNLPPNHLRVRVGVGNKILFNQIQHITTGINFWLRVFSENLCSMNSNIVDIGCGCGRIAAILRDYNLGEGFRFKGYYTGIDIDQEAIDWCREHFPPDYFSFIISGYNSSVYTNDYNKNKLKENILILPIQSESQDFVFSLSLFTHLLEIDVINYLEETYRILKKDGVTNMSFFSYDRMSRDGLLGGRFNFEHRISNAYVENLKYPEAAVAYESDFLRDRAHKIGFKDIVIIKWWGQDILQCHK